MINSFNIFVKPLMAPPDADGPAGFTTQWHGHGAGHQDNNEPQDTAADRHNFGDAKAGRSDQYPTQGSAQDDFSAETGLPLIPASASVDTEEDEMEEDLMLDF